MYAKSSVLHVNWFVAHRSVSSFRWHCIRQAVVFIHLTKGIYYSYGLIIFWAEPSTLNSLGYLATRSPVHRFVHMFSFTSCASIVVMMPSFRIFFVAIFFSLSSFSSRRAGKNPEPSMANHIQKLFCDKVRKKKNAMEKEKCGKTRNPKKKCLQKVQAWNIWALFKLLIWMLYDAYGGCHSLAKVC